VTEIKLQLDHDLEVKVKKFANGVGVDASELVERALIYALKSRFPRPDQGLPGSGEGLPHPDQGLPGQQPGSGARPDQGLPGSQPKPDQGLPGEQPGIDNELPARPGFRPEIDNELPEGEVPVDPDYDISGDRPNQGLPGGANPDFDPNLNPNIDRRGSGRPDQTLPPGARPKGA
jgi:hypothetical protein